MKKKKEYPEHCSAEIFNEFEKDSYKIITASKRNKASVKPLLFAGVIIYSVASFCPWSNIFF